MKTLLYGLLAAGLLSAATARGQSAPDSTRTDRYLLDFVVPDVPAFKALGTDPSNLLRPADVKKFAATLTPFYANRAGVIPPNFAVEFAPWKLASSRWTLGQYMNSSTKRALYRSSFSLGTVSDTSRFPRKLAIGYRLALLSRRADVLRAAAIKNNVFSASMNAMAAFTNITNHWVSAIAKPPIGERATYYQNHRNEFNQFFRGIKKHLEASPDATLEGLYAAYVAELKRLNPDFDETEINDGVQTFGEQVDAFLENYKSENWNASRFDLALAWAAQSPDSLITRAQWALASAWATAALRIHKNGQLLIGGNLTIPRRDPAEGNLVPKRRTGYNLNLRYYAGTQAVRGFAETQYRYRNATVADERLLLNLGAEFRVGGVFWVVASAGLENALNTPKPLSQLVSSLDLRYFFNRPQ